MLVSICPFNDTFFECLSIHYKSSVVLRLINWPELFVYLPPYILYLCFELCSINVEERYKYIPRDVTQGEAYDSPYPAVQGKY